MEISDFSQVESPVTGTCLQTPLRGLTEAVEVVAFTPNAAVLDEPEFPHTFRTVAVAIVELPIREIIHSDGFHDYRKPTSAEHPLVVQTPRGHYCIDGWDLVAAADMEGAEVVSCEVEVLAQHSEAELSIRKAASRIATRGGIALYPEKILHSRLCEEQLLASGGDLRSFGRGGRRFGEGFENDPEKDIIHVLSLRFMKDRDTITTYLHHGKYLSNEALQTLIDEEAPKQFFEKLQSKKQRLLDELEEQRATEFEKVERASSAMLQFFADWKEDRERRRSSRRACRAEAPPPQGGIIAIRESIPDAEGEDEDREQDVLSESESRGEETPSQLADDVEERGEDVLSEPNEDWVEITAQSSRSAEGYEEDTVRAFSEHAEALGFDDLLFALEKIAKRLIVLSELEELTPAELASAVREEIGALNNLADHLDSLAN